MTSYTSRSTRLLVQRHHRPGLQRSRTASRRRIEHVGMYALHLRHPFSDLGATTRKPKSMARLLHRSSGNTKIVTGTGYNGMSAGAPPEARSLVQTITRLPSPVFQTRTVRRYPFRSQLAPARRYCRPHLHQWSSKSAGSIPAMTTNTLSSNLHRRGGKAVVRIVRRVHG